MAVEYILLIAALLLLAIIFLFRFWQKDIVFDLKDINYKLFYYKDLRTQKEYISQDLKNILNIGHKDNQFDKLLSLVQDDDKNHLQDIFIKLNSSLKSNKKTVIRDIDLAIKITLKTDSNRLGVKYLSCQYMVLKNKKGFGKAFFIFFADITSDRLEVDQLKLEEQELRLKLNRITSLLEKIHFPIWFKDNKGNIIFANSLFRNNFDNIDPFAIERNPTAGLGFIERGKKFFEVNEQWLANKKFAVGYAIDASEKKQLKIDLKKYIESQANLLEASTHAVAIYTAEKKLKFFNQAFVKMWDLDEKWLFTSPFYEEILDEIKDKRNFPEHIDFKNFKKERIGFFKELAAPFSDCLFLPDRRTIKVSIVQHAFGGLIFTYEDITDKIALESSYKTLTAVQQKTINSLDEGIIVFNQNGKLAISNPQLGMLWNIKNLPKEFHYTKFLDLLKNKIPSGKYEDFHAKFMISFNNRETCRFVLENKAKKILEILFIPLPDGAILVNFKDITTSKLFERSLKEKNKALEQIDKLKTEFLNNISYELRSPLTSIIGFSEILQKEFYGKLNDQQSKCIDAINKSTDSLLTIINDILELASMEAGHVKLSKDN